jgi:ribokinase
VPPRVTVVGSVNVDLVARCERLPRPGETVTGATLERVMGGKGANQAVAAARLGAEVRLVAAVGDDPDGREAVDALAAAGVDTSGVATSDARTGVALITVAEDGENQIVVAPGANATLSASAVDVAGADAVLCQLEVPLEAVQAAAERARGLVCLNAAPARALPPPLLGRVDLLVVNRHEAELVDASAVRRTALTLGERGAVLLDRGREVARARPPHVEAVVGTAAGDAFTAALVVSLLEGREDEAALRRACAAGALAASRFGAQPSLPTAAEVDAAVEAA